MNYLQKTSINYLPIIYTYIFIIFSAGKNSKNNIDTKSPQKFVNTRFNVDYRSSSRC